MKRKSLINTLLGASMLCSIAGIATISTAAIEPETKEAKPEVHHDAEAIKVLDASIKASGGHDLLGAAESIHTTGSMVIPMAGLSGTMDVYAAEGGNMMVKINIPGFGEQLTGLKDGIGWSIDPMSGPKLLDAEQVAGLVEQADPQAALNYESRYTTIKYVGETEFNGKSVHQIDYISASTGDESTEYYSTETSLLAGSIAIANSEMGPIKITSIIDEYADFEGVKIPSKTTQKMGPQSFTITVDSLEVNKVEMSTFDYPDAIKSLIQVTKEDAEENDG